MEKTLRDEYAMTALNALIGRNWDHLKQDTASLMAIWATSAFAVADVMMAYRKLPPVEVKFDENGELVR